ncbi:hypothetical protein LCGC14_2623380 [marine sediment metagenome]|uniref:HNH domain-containing protein n=1 Tax=marine sediment metagenome TaxID=412755 RepID=A0A0F9AQ43_9ZZZZ
MPRGGPRPICSVEGCGRPHCARGFCSYHYQRDRLGISFSHPYQQRITWGGRPIENLSGAARSKRMRVKKQGAMLWYKMTHPCRDCGEGDPRVLDFDHVHGNKSFQLQEAKQKPLTEILMEIQKCDVVCANCHRLRTQERINGNGGSTVYGVLMEGL